MNTNERWVVRSVSKTPPPDTVQIDELAHAYGLIDGLRMSTSAIPFRCCWCDKMVARRSLMQRLVDWMRA